ncbi:helix-turn-helix transcriptional regulator [Staphylococcus saprophyticus]|uniref:helix-turn-helix domain-containing protein n=1 Tax=Staphylococcus saprophyticus TaxID=29385 RepID=UPI001013CBAE|nr:helix-turn-helix domain-containing protein [Staphylococcus saprophyticus]MBN6092364.1 helix-turn-helix transcriptional regulator [Staphylococcus saprophyticus]MDW4312502.1 helix-turn-helix domain-containing protein [Staphylococcus saprophyticus]MDW4371591.1 helix-turn-helix domain-containing protein [Staphylococcus saprophyticus]RXS01982.1 XRE family transcriptional regulator [Staphylococcus saprophyticus]
MKFSEILKAYRLSKNISVNNLAKLSGVSNAYISKLENNKRKFPTIRTIYLLLLGVENYLKTNEIISDEEIRKSVIQLLNSFIDAEDSNLKDESSEEITSNYEEFYNDMQNKADTAQDINRHKNELIWLDKNNSEQQSKFDIAINDFYYHLNDAHNEKFFRGVRLDNFDKQIIRDIINTYLLNKLEQETENLGSDIDQLKTKLSDFNRTSLLNKKEVQLYSNHNNIQTLKQKYDK